MKKPEFDILNPDLKIHRHYILEASAGTGKTFSIEHLVVRLLVEEPRLHIEEILVVTFTRASTKELRERILEAIRSTSASLKQGERIEYFPLEVDPLRAQIALERALGEFENSQIFTIHGFCEKNLREIAVGRQDELIEEREILQVIHYFFATTLETNYRKEQVAIVLKKLGGVEGLETELMRHLHTISEARRGKSFDRLAEEFVGMRKEWQGTSPEDILKSFSTLSESYKGIRNRQREIHPEIQENVDWFASLFHLKEWRKEHFLELVRKKMSFVEALSPAQCKAALPVTDPLFDRIKRSLFPVYSEATSYSHILLQMVGDCQELLAHYLSAKQRYRHDDILHAMKDALQDPHFSGEIRKKYRAAIIDEFQDTDPIQWEIFRSLFLEDPEKRSLLYLVGDPKQSIYAFRQADIYTYLQAAAELGPEAQYTLNTNYRSRPELVEALNDLFAAARGFIALPRISSHLPYTSVRAGKKFPPREEKGLHFCLVQGEKSRGTKWPTVEMEREIVFPWLAREIGATQKEETWAILVKDRYQGERVQRFLTACGIPSVTQREKPLIGTSYFRAMKDLLRALESPKDLSAVKRALGGILIRLPYSSLFESEEVHPAVERGIFELHRLKSVFQEEGFASCSLEFMKSSFTEQTVGEGMMRIGEELYDAFRILAQYIADLESRVGRDLKKILHHLLDLEKNAPSALLLSQGNREAAVRILTTHTSKGLEFDRVFALGIATRQKIEGDLVVVREGGNSSVTTADDPEAQRQFAELEAEKSRQLYVALTRAKQRLYVPLFLGRDLAEGEGSPLERLITYFETDFLSWIRNHPLISWEELVPSAPPERAPRKRREIDLVSPEEWKFEGGGWETLSFSKLAKRIEGTPIEGAPHDFYAPPSPHTIPAGREFGILFHEMMEKIPLGKIGKEGIVSYVEERVRGTPFEPWAGVIHQIVDKLLFAGPFPLKELDTYREMEFLYRDSKREIFVNGVIDLLFLHQGRYYIVDWKTNWLGVDETFYSQERMEEAMAQNGYHLQAGIYVEALKKYLQWVDPRPFEECFGGALYVFVRGVGYVWARPEAIS